jgi:tetratricopeptide (TPR) repeat protein
VAESPHTPLAGATERVRPGRRRHRATDFAGRAAELRALRSALAGAARGRGRLVLLVGEPGIGKTRLAEEFARQAAARGIPAYFGRVHEGADGSSYRPWIDLIGACVAKRGAPQAWAELSRDGASELARLVPELRDGVPAPADREVVDDGDLRFRLFEAVTRFFLREASDQPTLLVLDDLHWADEASLALLAYLSRSLRGSRLLVLGACREADLRTRPALGALLAGLDRESEPLALRGLAAADVARVVEAICGCPLPPRLLAAIHARTEGNPFFVREVARLLPVGGGALARADPSDLPVPLAVRAAIERQAGALALEARRTLETAAVIGREFGLGVLARATERKAADVLPHLEAATRAGLLESAADPLRPARFSHALVREALYDGIEAGRRCALHARVGETLEWLHRDDPTAVADALAHHFFCAAPGGDALRAVEHAERAAARALSVYAFEDAARQYARALEALELAEPAPARRLSLQLALGEARTLGGDLEGAAASFRDAAALARSLGSTDDLARAALGFARRRDSELGADPEVIGLLEQALVSRDLASPLRVRLSARLAGAVYFAGDPGRAKALARAAADEARALGDPETVAIALGPLHWIVWEPGNAAERLSISREGCEQARRSGNLALYWRSSSGPIEDLLELGDVAAVDAAVEVFAQGAAESRQPYLAWQHELLRALRAGMRGEFQEAESRSRAALELGERIHEEVARQWFAIQLFFLRRDQGRLAELEAPLRGLAARQPQAPWRAGLARLLAERGEHGEARALLGELVADGAERIRCDVNWPIRMSCLAEACAAVGDAAAAGALYRVLLPFAGRHVIVGLRIGYDGPASRYLGLLAATLGSRDEAEHHLEHAVRQSRDAGARPFEATCRYDLARALLARGAVGDAERAADELALSAVAARDLGMQGLARRVAELRAAGSATRANVVALPVPARGGRAIFQRDGEFWTVAFGGRVTRVRDSLGMRQIARLLREPGREWHALDLVADGAAARGAGSGELLDRSARRAYARRLSDLRAALDEAERFRDLARASALSGEIAALSGELARAVGLGGRDRRQADAAERARVNVVRTIRAAVRRIAACDAILGRYLERTLRTGTFCCYLPDSDRPLEWR